MMKKYLILFCFVLSLCMTLVVGGQSGSAAISKVVHQKTCVPLARTECSICDMEDPRAKRYPGIRYPRYFQGYPYYGYYLEGSSMGFSWSV